MKLVFMNILALIMSISASGYNIRGAQNSKDANDKAAQVSAFSRRTLQEAIDERIEEATGDLLGDSEDPEEVEGYEDNKNKIVYLINLAEEHNGDPIYAGDTLDTSIDMEDLEGDVLGYDDESTSGKSGNTFYADDTLDTNIDEEDLEEDLYYDDESTSGNDDNVQEEELMVNEENGGIEELIDAIQFDEYDLFTDYFRELAEEIDDVLLDINPDLGGNKLLLADAREAVLVLLVDDHDSSAINNLDDDDDEFDEYELYAQEDYRDDDSDDDLEDDEEYMGLDRDEYLDLIEKLDDEDRNRE